ncbi:hypothetical protein LTR66_000524 [Elasticomyces elasticus]|nr:hypothetical protein LTR66_000524 [Elasticomyces elasticus]
MERYTLENWKSSFAAMYRDAFKRPKRRRQSNSSTAAASRSTQATQDAQGHQIPTENSLDLDQNGRDAFDESITLYTFFPHKNGDQQREPLLASGLRPDESQSTAQSNPALTDEDNDVGSQTDPITYYFDGEDEGDYTDGPTKMIVAHDGRKDCAALLLTMDLSAKLQSALLGSREIQQAEQQAEKERVALARWEQDVRLKMSDASCRLAELCDPDLDFVNELSPPDRIKKAELLELQMQRYTSTLKEIEQQQNYIQQNMEHKYGQMRELQAQVNTLLDDALVHYDYGDEDIDPYDEDDNVGVLEIDDPPAYLEFLHARTVLRHARQAFDAREEQCETERDAVIEADRRGERVETPLQFDLRHLQKAREITRALIAAEEAYEEALIGARNAGIDLREFEIDSGFFSEYPDDELGSEDDPTSPGLGDILIVERWRKAVPEDADAEFVAEPEIDDWNAGEVDISDSLSAVAEDSERKRIDRWRDACQELMQDAARRRRLRTAE